MNKWKRQKQPIRLKYSLKNNQLLSDNSKIEDQVGNSLPYRFLYDQIGIKIPGATPVYRDFNMPEEGREITFDNLISPEVIRRAK